MMPIGSVRLYMSPITEENNMSYNCNTFKTKKIENLKIPVASLYKSKRSDWHLDRINNDDGSVTFSSMEEITLSGVIKNGVFICKSINCSGEGSGFIMNEILEPAYKDSEGELVASCVWEGGDSINRLIVKDGNVKWENVEI